MASGEAQLAVEDERGGAGEDAVVPEGGHADVHLVLAEGAGVCDEGAGGRLAQGAVDEVFGSGQDDVVQAEGLDDGGEGEAEATACGGERVRGLGGCAARQGLRNE